MQYTREELDKMLKRAVAAVRAALGSPDDDIHLVQTRQAAAESAVTDAVEAGIHHRQIAVQSGVSGLRVLSYITDLDLSYQALRAERHHAERYVDQVLEEIRGRALYLYVHGTGKTEVCKALGVSRPTLNAWIKTEGIEDRDAAA